MSNEEQPAVEQTVSDADLVRLDRQPIDGEKLDQDTGLVEELSKEELGLVVLLEKLEKEYQASGGDRMGPPMSLDELTSKLQLTEEYIQVQRSVRTLRMLISLNALILVAAIVRRVLRGRRERRAG